MFQSTPRAALALLLLLVIEAGVAAQKRETGQPPQNPQQAPQIEKPADPAAVKGSFTIAGRAQSVTAGEFYDAHLLLNRIEGTAQQGVTRERVWEHLLLAREAEALGIVVTDADVDQALQKEDSDLYDGIVRRWKQAGVDEAQGRAYTRVEKTIERMKDLWLNNLRFTTKDVFDLFKRTHYRYKLEYVRFAIEDFAVEVPRDQVDEATLRTFYNDNKIIQSQFRTPNTISAEFIYLDMNAVEGQQESVAKREITREEALEYFQKNKDQLLSRVPPDKQHLLVFDKDTPLDKIQSPFALLEETIKKTLLSDEQVRSAHKEALAAAKTGDLEEVAKKHRLGYQKVVDLDRPQSVQQLARFGFNAFVNLNNAPEGEVCPSIVDERGVRYFFRLNRKVASLLPEFEQIREKILDKYVETQTLDKARKAAAEFVAFLNSRLDEKIVPLQEKLMAEADEEAKKKIAEQGMTREEDKNRVVSSERAKIRQKIEDEKRKLRPALFDAYVAEKKLKMSATDYFELQPMRTDRASIKDIEENRNVFLKTNYYLQSLQPGDVTPVYLEDPQTKCFFFVRLADKAEPEMSTMSAGDYHQNLAQLRQQKEAEFLQRYRYGMIALRTGLQVKN